MTSGAAVEVTGLTKRFGDFTAVDEISFAVEPGELFGCLGPNGAGKTTTISILCTLLTPTGGTARVGGHDVALEQSAVRSSIGLVFQEVTLDDDLTGAENLRFHAVLYGVPPREVRHPTLLLPSVAPLTLFSWTLPLWADALFTLTFGTLMLALAVRRFAKTE